MTSPLKTVLYITLASAVIISAAALTTTIFTAEHRQGSTQKTHAQSSISLIETEGLVPLRPLKVSPEKSQIDMAPAITQQAAAISAPEIKTESLNSKSLGSANISVARLHKGRFLPTPYAEARAWQDLKLGATAFTPLPASAHFDVLPSIAQNGVDSDNKIDEIRLAAIDARSDYVLIYAVGKDAFWGEFGGKPLEHTGLTVDAASPARENGDAKAILVQAHNGHVLGAVTTWAPDMETLTAEVKKMIEHL